MIQNSAGHRGEGGRGVLFGWMERKASKAGRTFIVIFLEMVDLVLVLVVAVVSRT